ncbi:hypothetical protein BDV25DRAFT_143621 [Aspergillus avenaceus]|uniref:Uncharacterized protein n=1 Tax=Aspergillus avenaceus TaxID=36643 RepID=A0A5N6TJK6_ASPAV|nr:hypothetical protein BDV25DRAFT_143621 [Aspergillus avenaceus]
MKLFIALYLAVLVLASPPSNWRNKPPVEKGPSNKLPPHTPVTVYGLDETHQVTCASKVVYTTSIQRAIEWGVNLLSAGKQVGSPNINRAFPHFYMNMENFNLHHPACAKNTRVNKNDWTRYMMPVLGSGVYMGKKDPGKVRVVFAFHPDERDAAGRPRVMYCGTVLHAETTRDFVGCDVQIAVEGVETGSAVLSAAALSGDLSRKTGSGSGSGSGTSTGDGKSPSGKWRSFTPPPGDLNHKSSSGSVTSMGDGKVDSGTLVSGGGKGESAFEKWRSFTSAPGDLNRKSGSGSETSIGGGKVNSGTLISGDGKGTAPSGNERSLTPPPGDLNRKSSSGSVTSTGDGEGGKENPRPTP